MGRATISSKSFTRARPYVWGCSGVYNPSWCGQLVSWRRFAKTDGSSVRVRIQVVAIIVETDHHEPLVDVDRDEIVPVETVSRVRP